jgi:hypothetical protein
MKSTVYTDHYIVFGPSMWYGRNEKCTEFWWKESYHLVGLSIDGRIKPKQKFNR